MNEDHVSHIDSILDGYRNVIGDEFAGYRNHVCRMVKFCHALEKVSPEATEKVVIAGCFHDIGIWTGGTFDYLPPSIQEANEYLVRNGLESWSNEISQMIGDHHKLRNVPAENGPLAETFRKADLVDFSLGMIKCGVPRHTISAAKMEFPNAGFHICLVKLAGRWVIRHPLNPVPVLKW